MLPPPRPKRSPLILMLVLAMIPAIGLAYTWRWAEAKIPGDTLEVPNDSTASSDPTDPTATTVAASPVVPLDTPLLSVRRAPQTIVAQTSQVALVESLALLSGFIGETSCLVVSLDGRIVYDHMGDIPVTPASNQKLLVAAVALEALTPGYTFSTSLRGIVVDGVVTGDLYFVGGGDPLLSTQDYPETQEYPPTSTTSIETLVANLVASGITRVQGNVIADESRYDDERYVPTWGNDIRGVEAGPLSALMLNDAVRKVEPGSTTRQQDAATGAATELIRLLQDADISIGGSARAGVATPDIPEITSVQSAPLSEIVAEMLTTSDDNTAELLLKELGVAKQVGNTRAAGLEVLNGTLATWGIDVSKLTLVDGSGLDSTNVVTCNTIRQVLVHQPLSGPLGVGLAIAAETGTLADETSLGPDMAGRLHAKTGTLSDVKALSGYVTTDAGSVEFALILNSEAADESYAGIWGAMADAFSKYPAGPTIEDIQPR